MPIPDEDDATELALARDALIEDLDSFSPEEAADCLADADCVEDGIEYAIELQEALVELTQRCETFLSLARKEIADTEPPSPVLLS